MSGEDFCNMDKKNGNRPSVSTKGNGNDGKTKTDNGTARYQRNPKRRDYNNTKSYQDSGNVRKPIPQKNRESMDKRPRPRTSYQQREYMTDEDRADYESALHLRSKKGNLNHLLNFTYSREDAYDDRSTRHYPRGGRSGRHYSSGRYNKEQFLQANCQFIVKADGDYTKHSHSPDMLVDWDCIEFVRVYSHELSSCPICLLHPVAAKMTRCGHIYCWACILHYLSLGEKTWRKCPICYESIHEKDLKSVITQEVHQYKVGETITMRLMKRERGGVSAYPNSLWVKDDGKLRSMNDEEVRVRFLKLLVATKQDVMKHVIEPEQQALDQQMTNAEPSEVAFIDSALHLLKAREECLISDKASVPNVQKPPSPVQSQTPSKASDTFKHSKEYSSAFSDEEIEVDQGKTKALDEPVKSEATPSPPGDEVDTVFGSPENLCPIVPVLGGEIMPAEEAAEHLEMPSSPATSKYSTENAFYFYQAADGQHIYLHALNARCLVHENSALSQCPETITAKIVEMEHISTTEELRKRLRYLSHLPLTCEFQVAELSLKPPIVSKDTLKHFSGDIEKRKRLRQKKYRQEKHWNRKAEDEERKKYGMTASNVTVVRSQFGMISENRPVSPAAKSDDSSASSLMSPIGSPEDTTVFAPEMNAGSSEIDGQQTSNISFAQMLKAGKAQAVAWPKVKKDEALSPGRPSNNINSDESDQEDKVPVPVFQNSFGDAFQTALENLAKSPPTDVDTTAMNIQKQGGSGKKKKKKLLLFSTAMARGGK